MSNLHAEKALEYMTSALRKRGHRIVSFPVDDYRLCPIDGEKHNILDNHDVKLLASIGPITWMSSKARVLR